jgi:hypothetical protein
VDDDGSAPAPEGALAELIETERRIETEVAEAVAAAERLVESARAEARSVAEDAWSRKPPGISAAEALYREMQEDRLFAALQDAGMPEVPGQFSVAPWPQEIPRATLARVDSLIRVFEQVTRRTVWHEMVTASAPEIARQRRPEVCFFSAWDFHIPPEEPDLPRLIEFNDNGSGLLFAGLIDHFFYEASAADWRRTVAAPFPYPNLTQRVAAMVERESELFFGQVPEGLFLILDDADSMQRGRFRRELILQRDLFRHRGWKSEIASNADVCWSGGHLLWRGQEVSFVVNRSTDFFWEAGVCSHLRKAYREGRVYVAPNPFTYATRSDKRLLEFLSRPHWDEELGIRAEERRILSAHVPETWLLREDNAEEIARRKQEFVLKPVHGFAGRGLLPSSQVGHSRLRRLLRKGEGYVAQRRVPKSRLEPRGAEGAPLWTDLRVWAYRGERFLLSGRASRRPDALDLAPPGGWLPTYARV